MRGRPPVYKYVPGVQIREGCLYKYTYRGLNYLLKAKVTANPDYFNLDLFELQSPQTLTYQNEGTATTANPDILGLSKVRYREGGEVRNTNNSAVPFVIAKVPAFIGIDELTGGYIYADGADTEYNLLCFGGATFPGYKVENRYIGNTLVIGKLTIGETITVNLEKMDSFVNSDDYLTVSFQGYTVNIVTTPVDSSATHVRYNLPTGLGATKVLTLFNNAGTIDITCV